jgi:hypothetical protein
MRFTTPKSRRRACGGGLIQGKPGTGNQKSEAPRTTHPSRYFSAGMRFTTPKSRRRACGGGFILSKPGTGNQKSEAPRTTHREPVLQCRHEVHRPKVSGQRPQRKRKLGSISKSPIIRSTISIIYNLYLPACRSSGDKQIPE